MVLAAARAPADGRGSGGALKAPLRDHQSVAADPRAGAGVAAHIVRRAEPLRGRPGRQRPQIPGPDGRDLLDHLQSQPTLLLLPEDAGRRSRADPLLRLGAGRSCAVFRPYRLRRPDLAARRAAARKPRGSHASLLPTGSLALTHQALRAWSPLSR